MVVIHGYGLWFVVVLTFCCGDGLYHLPKMVTGGQFIEYFIVIYCEYEAVCPPSGKRLQNYTSVFSSAKQLTKRHFFWICFPGKF